MVEVKTLSGKAHGFSPVTNINFKLQNGQVYGILGDENSGGSTLLALLAGAALPSSGEVLLGGIDTVRESLTARRSVGYFPHTHLPPSDLTPAEYLMMAAEMKGMEYNRAIRRVEELLEWASLEKKRSALIRRLSPSDVRLLGIAQTLLGNPEFLLLDKVTYGLPAKETQGIRNWICELRGAKTVFLYSQNESELREICDRILVLEAGVLLGILSPDEPLPQAFSLRDAPKETPAASPKKTSRWTLLTSDVRDYEVIETDGKEDRR